MRKAPVAVIHTVGSLTPNSGVTPVISNSLSYKQAVGQLARCVVFSDHYRANRWSGLTGALRLILPVVARQMNDCYEELGHA